jgi:hypothetical protein
LFLVKPLIREVGAMPDRSLLSSLRGPLVLMGIAVAGIVAGWGLDQTSAREHALVVGAPALTILLPVSIGWAFIAALLHARRRQSTH